MGASAFAGGKGRGKGRGLGKGPSAEATCFKCGSAQHWASHCPKGDGKSKSRSHFADGLFGYGVWPADGAGSSMFSGVSVGAEHYALEDNDAPLTLLDEHGDALPEEVAEPYRASSQWRAPVRSLVEIYESSRWTQPTATPVEDPEDSNAEEAAADFFDLSAGTSGQGAHPTTGSGGSTVCGQRTRARTATATAVEQTAAGRAA